MGWRYSLFFAAGMGTIAAKRESEVMAMSVPFEKELENVAREWVDHSCGDEECALEGSDCLAEYLQRHLLPLLKAGHAMRENRVNISDDAMAWDAARERLAQLEKR